MRKYVLFFIVVLAAVFIILIGTGQLTARTQVFFFGPTSVLKDQMLSILILGYAGGNHEGTYLTDTLLLMYINMSKKTVVLISIPRDLWVPIPNKSEFVKINTLYEKGLFDNSISQHSVLADTQLVRNVVTRVSGISVNKVVLVNFGGFEKMIDLLGGLDVTVDKPFEDKEYPIAGKEADTCGKSGKELEDAVNLATESAQVAFPCRYETVQFDAGIMHMDGATALKYARSRHGSGEMGDFSRAKRQQYILEATKDKVLSPSSVPQLNSLFDTLKVNILTDISPTDTIQLIREIPSIKKYSIHTVALDLDNVLNYDYSPDGQYILMPKEGMDKWDQAKQFIKNSTLPSLSSIATPSVTLKN